MADAATKKYEDLDPLTETKSEKDCDTIIVLIPAGFKKENLRVQLTTSNFVRIMGERETADKLLRFQKRFPVTANTDTNKITAKFESGILSVRLPKLIIPEDKPQPRINGQHQTAEGTSPSDGSNKQADVPQKTTEKDDEKSRKTVDSGSLGQKSESNAAKAGEGSKEDVDGSGKGKTRLVEPTSKLKMSRRAFYMVLLTSAAVGVGLYLTSFIRSFRTSENSV